MAEQEMGEEVNMAATHRRKTTGHRVMKTRRTRPTSESTGWQEVPDGTTRLQINEKQVVCKFKHHRWDALLIRSY